VADAPSCQINDALRLIPSGMFVLTAAHEHTRGAVLVRWVQPCGGNPPMVMVAMPLGQAVEPLIRDSRSFALCQVSAEDRFTERKFATTFRPGEDPLIAMVRQSAPSGSPIIDRAISYLDCELTRHFDIESDCGLYVGLVRHAAVLNGNPPAIVIGENGHKGDNGASTINGHNG